MKKLLAGLFAVLCVTSFAQAITLDSIEKAGDVSGKTQTLKDPITVGETQNRMIAGGASLNGSATGNTVTVKIDIADTNDGEAPNEAANHYIAGGAVYNNTAENNTVNISEGVTVEGRAVAGGLARVRNAATVDAEKWSSGSALNNTVNITGATVAVAPQNAGTVFFINGSDPVAVAGGASQYYNGDASGNTVNITNGSTINGAVVGGLSYVQTTQEEVDEHEHPSRNNDNNTVFIQNSTVTGDVYGSYGGVYGNGNLVRLDGATVNGNAIAAESGFTSFDSSSNAALGTFNNNRLELVNGTTVNSAAAVDANNNNASGNSMYVENSTVLSGTLYTVKMIHGLEDNSSTLSGVTDNNTLTVKNTPVTVNEIGGALNFTGNPSGNTVNLSGSDITVAYDANKTLGGEMNVTNMVNQHLFGSRGVIPALDTANGYIFGGATADYQSQVGSGSEAPENRIVGFGSSADNNTVNIAGGNVQADVIGGLAVYAREVNYSTTKTDEETGHLTEQVTVVKDGLTTTTTTTTWTKKETKDETTGATTISWEENTTSSSDTADLIDDVFSASNNTVLLTDVTLNGNVYGGYVDGAELKLENARTQNNTVILSGNTKINGTVYGGGNAYFAETNKLYFRNIADGENFVSYDPKQFKNFNSLWNIEGNFDTRLQFSEGDVHAVFTLDKSAMQEHEATTVIKTGDPLDDGYGHVNCNGTDNCIKYNSDITLSNDKMGVYRFELTPEIDGDVVKWTLSSVKSRANAEIYGQLPLVGLALASEGPEMLTHTLSDAWKSDTDFNTFVNAAYHHTRYETGSGFDLDSGVFHAGAWKKFTDDWMGGFFAKFATGSYETYPVKVTGDANVYGGGLMTSYRYSETGRLEADVEVGYMDMDFNSSELLSSFKSKGLYYGATAGFVESLMQDLDLFANIHWLRKEKDDITDSLDQKIKFDAMQSLALRFGADYTISALDLGSLVPSVGVSGIYEFDGKSTVVADGTKSDDASLKGLSGRGQLSLAYQNNDSFLPLRTVLTVYGQAGKREGFGGEVNISFEF